jgi:hypothetical protein
MLWTLFYNLLLRNCVFLFPFRMLLLLLLHDTRTRRSRVHSLVARDCRSGFHSFVVSTILSPRDW